MPGCLDGAASGVIMAPSNLGGVIIGERGAAASVRAECEEGGVAAVSTAVRPLRRCQAKIGGPG